jgi:hypothetical protein
MEGARQTEMLQEHVQWWGLVLVGELLSSVPRELVQYSLALLMVQKKVTWMMNSA